MKISTALVAVAALAGAGLPGCSLILPYDDDGAGGAQGTGGDAGACPAPTCEGQQMECHAYDFAGPACPADWDYVGDPMPPVVQSCASGKLHVAAQDTLDATAALFLEAPILAYSIHVSARIGVTAWDTGPVLTLQVGAQAPFMLVATPAPANDIRHDLCHAGGCTATFEAGAGEEHLFELDITTAGTTARVGCNPFGTTPSVPLPTNATLILEFGHADANPIDGTLDDVVVSFDDP
jgi:hypothetical protein